MAGPLWRSIAHTPGVSPRISESSLSVTAPRAVVVLNLFRFGPGTDSSFDHGIGVVSEQLKAHCCCASFRRGQGSIGRILLRQRQGRPIDVEARNLPIAEHPPRCRSERVLVELDRCAAVAKGDVWGACFRRVTVAAERFALSLSCRGAPADVGPVRAHAPRGSR